MGIILGLITSPALGVPRMVHWLTRTLAEEAEREFLDEGRIRAGLLEVQQQYEAGDIPEEEYDRREGALLEHLNTVRQIKESYARGR